MLFRIWWAYPVTRGIVKSRVLFCVLLGSVSEAIYLGAWHCWKHCTLVVRGLFGKQPPVICLQNMQKTLYISNAYIRGRSKLKGTAPNYVNILSRIPGLCGSVTNNSTWIRIGYRIYSLWTFITTQITITDYWHSNSQLNTDSDLAPLITVTLLNTGFRLL
jgi:hypothetical protein